METHREKMDLGEKYFKEKTGKGCRNLPGLGGKLIKALNWLLGGICLENTC